MAATKASLVQREVARRSRDGGIVALRLPPTAQRVEGRRGAHCTPGQFYAAAKRPGRIWNPPLRRRPTRLVQFQLCIRRGAFHMLPCSLTPTQDSTGEHCSPLQPPHKGTPLFPLRVGAMLASPRHVAALLRADASIGPYTHRQKGSQSTPCAHLTLHPIFHQNHPLFSSHRQLQFGGVQRIIKA